MTFLSCLDREGTVATTYPNTDRFIFVDSDDNMVALDVAQDSQCEYGIKFEDADWGLYLSSIRPICLNLGLNTNCDTLLGKRRTDHHRRFTPLLTFGANKARQTCMCRYASEVGFTVDNLQEFVKIHEELILQGAKAEDPKNRLNFETSCVISTFWKDCNGSILWLTK